MFARAYWPAAYFPAEFWPESDEAVVVEEAPPAEPIYQGGAGVVDIGEVRAKKLKRKRKLRTPTEITVYLPSADERDLADIEAVLELLDAAEASQ